MNDAVTPIIGIDLGTTNSLVAVWKNGQATLIPNALGEYLTPSCVGLDEDGSILVGKAARERLQTHPQRTAALFKRYMGSNRETRLGKKVFRAEELASLVLRALKEDAESYLGQPVIEAIITVPAYFSDAQRKATKAAGQLAGLRVDALLNEPTAAALAYGIHDKKEETKFLVFDLGGGTFDVSILDLFEGVMEVRASAGDNLLGGEDFVEVLQQEFLQRTALDIEKSKQPAVVRQRVREAVERAKRQLTQTQHAVIELQVDGVTHQWQVTEEGFLQLSEPLLQRLRRPVEQALRDSRIPVAELDNVVLAGGATRMPIVRKLVGKMFGRLPASHLNPDEVVALGAAVQAGLKMRDAALAEMVMTDVCPYSLGIEITRRVSGNTSHLVPGHYMPIIERNSAVPISRVESICTVAENQRELLVRIYQGEGRLVKDNIYLGELRFPVPPRPAGEVSVSIRFTYDVNGLLEVEATVDESGQSHKVVIEENPGVLSQEEIAQRFRILEALKIHPREQAENRVLLARADRLYEQSLGGARHFVGDQTAVFQSVLERQNLEEIRRARSEFARALDSVETGSPLE